MGASSLSVRRHWNIHISICEHLFFLRLARQSGHLPHHSRKGTNRDLFVSLLFLCMTGPLWPRVTLYRPFGFCPFPGKKMSFSWLWEKGKIGKSQMLSTPVSEVEHQFSTLFLRRLEIELRVLLLRYYYA